MNQRECRKRCISVPALLLCAALLAGCAPASKPASAPADAPSGTDTGGALPADATSVTLRIVDGAGSGDLLLAGMGESGGLYRLSVQPEDAVAIDGQAAAAADLIDGMELTVFFDGQIAESWPCQFYKVYALEAAAPVGGSYYDLCGLYLKVLDDLWSTDPALNDGIPVAGLDLSEAPGALSEGEKDGIAWRFGELHGVEVVRGTMEELIERGYITQGDASLPYCVPLPYWENGCLFSITGAAEDCSPQELRFNAQKWCSGTGADFFTDCTALWPELGPWTEYTVGGYAIA